MINIKELQTNNYYIFQINHKCLESYPKFVQTYMKHIIGRFEGSYEIHGNKSYIFNHTLPNSHYMIFGALTMVASNHVHDKDNFFDWTSHIYKDRLVISKDITPIVRKIVDKFKYLLVLKQKRNVYAIWALTQKGCNRDVIQEIMRKIT